MKRRSVVLALLAAGAVLMSTLSANAQNYPTRPIKVIVGFAAGGTVDAITRIYADKLSHYLGQPFIVENQPGAGGHIASVAAARAQPDGYTFFIATNANTTGVSLYEKLNYKFPDDFEPIGLLAGAPSALVVSPAVKINSVKELVDAAKAKPGELVYGSAGIGTGTHMAAEWFQMATQTKLTHVPYKGLGPAMADLMAGRLSILFSPYGTVSGLITSGKVTGLAITTERRSSLAPDLPTMVEGGIPDFDVTLWLGLVAPRSTPAPILDAVAKAIATVQADKDLAARLANAGGEPLASSRSEFASFLERDIARWAKVVEYAGVRIK
jgi:tripartite-type tricarboxylate transporter receptor subunit TctC